MKTHSAYKIVVLISGGGSNLQAIIDQIEVGNINAEISAVISNRADAYGLKRAEKAGIANEFLDHKAFDSRESFDKELQRSIDKYEPDLIVLAGFMRILTDAFVEHYQGRMINIHPSLLPLYKGLNTHQRALADNQKKHGASVHFVIPELDAGLVIMQGIVPVVPDDTEDTLAERVHIIEHIIYPKTIKLFAENRLRLIDDHMFLDKDMLKEPIKTGIPL